MHKPSGGRWLRIKQSQLQTLSSIWLGITVRTMCDVNAAGKIRKHLVLSLHCINEETETVGAEWRVQGKIARAQLFTITKISLYIL